MPLWQLMPDVHELLAQHCAVCVPQVGGGAQVLDAPHSRPLSHAPPTQQG